MNPRTILSITLLAHIGLFGGLAPAQFQVLPTPDAERLDDVAPRLDLLRADDGRIHFRARRVPDDASFGFLIASTHPEVRPITPTASGLAEPTLLDWAPVTGDEAEWSGIVAAPARLDEPDWFFQLVVLRSNGQPVAGAIQRVDPVGGRHDEPFGGPDLNRDDDPDTNTDIGTIDPPPPDRGDVNPIGGRFRDCQDDDETLTYDGPPFRAWIADGPAREATDTTLHAAAVVPSTGYALTHMVTQSTECGADVFLMLDEPWAGQPVLPVINTVREEVRLRAEDVSDARIRVYVGRIRIECGKLDCVLYWDFQLAAVIHTGRR